MVGLAVAVGLLGLLAVSGVVSGVRDSRRRRRRDEPARHAAFRRILDARLPDAVCSVDADGADAGRPRRSWDDGLQVRIVAPTEPHAGEPEARPQAIQLPHRPPSRLPSQLPSQRPRLPSQRPGRQHVPSTEPCRSSLPPV